MIIGMSRRGRDFFWRRRDGGMGGHKNTSYFPSLQEGAEEERDGNR
jgi:hypothetical protein